MGEESDYLSVSRRRKRKRRILWIFSLAVISLYVVLLLSAWAVVKSPLFHVKNIVVTGNSVVSESDVRTLLWIGVFDSPYRGFKAVLGFGNILAWPDKFPSADLAYLPALQDLTIEKNYGARTVTVVVTERKPYGIWCLKTQMNADTTQTDSNLRQSACYWFDDSGVVFSRAPDAEGGLIPTVHDYSPQHQFGQPCEIAGEQSKSSSGSGVETTTGNWCGGEQSGPGLNSKVLSDNLLPNLFSVFNVLRASGLSIEEIRLNDVSLQELEVETVNGPKLYFSLRFPSDNDLAVIKEFMAKGGFNSLQYVDFRVENRAYYK